MFPNHGGVYSDDQSLYMLDQELFDEDAGSHSGTLKVIVLSKLAVDCPSERKGRQMPSLEIVLTILAINRTVSWLYLMTWLNLSHGR